MIVVVMVPTLLLLRVFVIIAFMRVNALIRWKYFILLVIVVHIVGIVFSMNQRSDYI